MKKKCLTEWLHRLFCRHEYEKIGWYEEEENNLLFAMRIYRCTRCGKTIEVDGRYDPYFE